MSRIESEEQRQWRRQKLRETESPYWTCPIWPWVEELLRRVDEARTVGVSVLNLSYTHPRGYFPNQICWRPAILKIIRDGHWKYDRMEGPPVQFPERYFIPPGLDPRTLEYCDTKPFEEEIELRYREAYGQGFWADAGPDYGQKYIPGAADLTGFHPRGEIPNVILKRLERRKDPKWREQVQNEIDKILASANQDEGRAKTAESRAEGVATRPDGLGDPTALLRSALELRARAEQARAQARFLRFELGYP